MDPPAGTVTALSAREGPETVKVRLAEVPPPGAGVRTVMLGVPAVATSRARMAAVSLVADTKVVARGLPLTRTTDLPTKFAPVEVEVKAGATAAAGGGIMHVHI